MSSPPPPPKSSPPMPHASALNALHGGDEDDHDDLGDDLVELSGRPSEQLIGTVLDGRFRIERVLGEGGMGVVYYGRDLQTGEQVGIKLLRADFVADDEIVQRFLNEAQAASRIGSPHIITVYGVGTAESGACYFVMEFLDGASLANVLASERLLPVARAIRIGAQMCAGLQAAHSAGIVHRDLKPDNIMLLAAADGSDFVKVLDFGVAKVSGASSKLTRAGSVFGTPHYMSPEQAGGSDIDARADVYSLGILLYEMVAGRVPFDDENMMNVLSHQMFREPTPVREASPQLVPVEYAAVVHRCLRKDVNQRYATMAEVLAALVQVMEALPPGRFEEVIPESNRPFSDNGERAVSATIHKLPNVSQKPGHGKWLALAAGMTTALLGAGLWQWRSASEPVTEPARSALVAPPQVAAEPLQRQVRVSVSPKDASAQVAGRSLRAEVVGERAEFTLDFAADAVPTLTLTAPGYVTQQLPLSSERGANVRLELAPQVEADASAVTAQIAAPAPKKAPSKATTVRPQAAPATKPSAGKPRGCISSSVDPFGDCSSR